MKTKPLPNIETLKDFLTYDEHTGLFTRNPSKCIGSQAKLAGKPAGFIYTRTDGKRKDVRIKIQGIPYLAHRLAWMIKTGDDPKEMEIDHINGNSTDNRFVNLRLVSRTDNCRNAKMRSDNKSGITGVSFDRRCGQWRSQTGSYDKRLIETFDNLFDACCHRFSMLNAMDYSSRHGL